MKNTLTTVCFTGHRPEGMVFTEQQAKALLRPAIEACVRKGATNFITGMARGIDLWAADIVLELKQSHPELQLFAAVPFPVDIFTARWNQADKKHYSKVITNASGVHYLSNNFNMAAYQQRNIYMIDRADLVIAFWTGKQSGGTYNAITYANKINKPIVNTCRLKKPQQPSKETRIIKRETR